MKNILFTIILITSISIFSQDKYVCTASLSVYNRPDEVQVVVYEKSGDLYKRTNDKTNNVAYYKILQDNAEFITLVESYEGRPSLFVVFINKVEKTFYEQYLSEDERFDGDAPLRGTFIIIN
jgi:hypothetical protein